MGKVGWFEGGRGDAVGGFKRGGKRMFVGKFTRYIDIGVQGLTLPPRPSYRLTSYIIIH